MSRTADERKRANAAAAAKSRAKAKKDAKIAELEAALANANAEIQKFKGALKIVEIRAEAKEQGFAEGAASVKKSSGLIGQAVGKAKEWMQE